MRPAQMYTVCLIALVFVYPTEARGLSKLWSIIDVDLLNSSTNTNTNTDEPVTYLWPMPKKSSNGNMTIAIDPDLVLVMQGNGGHSRLLRDAFARYKQIILAHHVKFSDQSGARQAQYGIGRLIITVSSADETLQLGMNESYSLYVPAHTKGSVIQDAMLEVERLVEVNYPDPADLEKAKKLLKEHEFTILEAIARLAEVSDDEYDTEDDGRGEGSDGEPFVGEGGVASDNMQDGYDADEYG